MRVAIIGAGLAGTSAAYVLKQHGLTPVIYEATSEIAAGASGNYTGLYNPRLSAQPSFYGQAFQELLRVLPKLDDIYWRRCGSLHLVTDEKRRDKFKNALFTWGWPEKNMRMVNAKEASEIAGIEIVHDALYMPDAGVVSPRKLCEAYAKGVEVHYKSYIKDLRDVHADFIVVANGMGASYIEQTKDYPLKAVRGQITYAVPSKISQNLRTNLCYGGYVTPHQGGVHAVGATFQRWLDHSEILSEDDADNLAKMREAVPSLVENMGVIGHRAAVRCTTDQHTPIIERVRGTKNAYASLAHGSHGIITSLMAAHLIADDIIKRS